MTEDNTPTTWSDLTSARFGSEADAGTDWRGSSSVTAFGQERTVEKAPIQPLLIPVRVRIFNCLRYIPIFSLKEILLSRYWLIIP